MKAWAEIVNWGVRLRKLLLIIYTLIGLIMFNACKETPITGNFKPLLIITENPTQYEKVELALYEKELRIASEGNPFDYDYMSIIGEFKAPSGKIIKIPAFWYQHYSIDLNTALPHTPSGIHGVPSTSPEEPQGVQIVTAVGTPHYRFRLKPEESGEWTYKLLVYKKHKLQEEVEGKFAVAASASTSRGIIKVDPTNNRNFSYANGETFIPIGQNLAWYTSTSRQAVDYQVWFSKMAENNMNFARLWLADWGFALHSGASYNNFSGRYAALARLDSVFDMAEEYDIKFMLALNHHGQFSTITNPIWDRNPWNAANGGPCTIPLNFFKDENIKNIYKNQLLYLIARYSYSEQLMAWELFNEIGWIDNYSQGILLIKTWHNEMANYIKANDPYQHLVTTSDKGKASSMFTLDSIDFACPHSYDYQSKSITGNVPEEQDSLYDLYNKPILYAELGINYQNGALNYQADPTAIHVKQGLWSGMMGGGAGGAMNWWWDSYIHPYDLYDVFKGAGVYSSYLNMNGQDYEQLFEVDEIEISNAFIDILGYRFSNRIYGYLFDKTWSHYNSKNILPKNDVNIIIPFENGNYQLKIYNTNTGELVKSENLVVNDGLANFIIEQIQYDLAFIIEE